MALHCITLHGIAWLGPCVLIPAGFLCLLLDLLVVELGQDVREVGVAVGQAVEGCRCISPQYLTPAAYNCSLSKGSVTTKPA